MSSDFEKVGTIQLSGSKRSLKILIEDPNRVLEDVYFVSVRDVQMVLREPKKAAQIVKVKDNGEKREG